MVAAERFFDGKYDYILDLPDDEDDGEDDNAGPSSKAKNKVLQERVAMRLCSG
jgi:hypothetical protein